MPHQPDLRFDTAPVLCAHLPVSKEVRDGQQIGVVTKYCEKVAPPASNRSRVAFIAYARPTVRARQRIKVSGGNGHIMMLA